MHEADALGQRGAHRADRVAASPASPASRCAVHLLGFDEIRHLKPAMFTLPRFHSDLRGRFLLASWATGIIGSLGWRMSYQRVYTPRACAT
jgi:hypothetical protein